MKRFLLAGAAVVGACCGAGADEPPIKIGFAIAESGWMFAYDKAPFEAAKLKIDEINAAGGLLGRKIEFDVRDTRTDQEQSSRAGQELVQKGVDLLIVSSDYDFGAPAALAAQSAGVVAISPGAADPKMGVQGVGPFVFTANGAAQVEGMVMAEWGFAKKGIRNPYVLEDQSIEYSKSGCAGFRSAWKKVSPDKPLAGGSVFSNGDISIAAQITDFKSQSSLPDSIFLCSVTPGGASAIRQIRAAGIDVPILANVGMTDDYWLGAVPNLSNFYVPTFMSIFGNDPRPELNAFLKSYEEKYGRRPESAYAVLGYSLIEQWKLAVERAGTTKSPEVVAQLEKFKDEPLTIGPTSYSHDLHIQANRPLLIMEVQNGKHSSVEVWRNKNVPSTALLFRVGD
ncbi:ABC transporter substrate-binding protein [Aminobacter niigataensis]|uniref:ABC transporter substrate-binding protein n=1 Tax=Aminobacter niigataensis TaxID=83265 RepID=UPI0024C51239|nr:ABC transporter substrate-binding protein [Aminobacter niigataensis]CAI2931838.1 ABC transporter substrate-binding protein [Aminobacter niigataensis]